MFTTPKIIAHRGASALAPENTMAAFEKARILGCKCIEFDVRYSADNVPMVHHDDKLDRTTNATGMLQYRTYSDLKLLDAGSWFGEEFAGEGMVTVRDLLDWLNHTNMIAHMELKSVPADQMNGLFHLIRNTCPPEKQRILVSSFDTQLLKLCLNGLPEYPRGLILNRWHSDTFDLAHSLGCISIILASSCTTKARVAEIKQRGYDTYVFAVPSRARAKRLLSWGVDSLYLDNPDLEGFVLPKKEVVC